MQRLSGLSPMCILIFGLTTVLAFAETGTIQVKGTGTVMTKPNLAEIRLSVQGQDEVAGDAIKKYDQALKQIKTAIEKLNMENLKVEMLGLGVSQVGQSNQVVFNGQPQNNAKQPITFVKDLRLTLSEIDKVDESELSKILAKVLDTAKDAGATIKNQNAMAAYFGQQVNNPMVHFVVEGVDESREKAYAQAIQKATKRADKLSELANMKVTGVKSIQESFSLPTDEGNPQTRLIYAMYGMQQNETKEHRVVSSVFKPIEVVVTLTIDYEIVKR